MIDVLIVCLMLAFLTGRTLRKKSRRCPNTEGSALRTPPDAVVGPGLRAWLFTILHNQHVNDVRRGVREGNNVELTEASSLTIQSHAIPTLQLRDPERAIGKLPPEQRQVILLVGLEGMAYEEVAKILKIPVGTARSRLSRGRDQLRLLMGMEEKLGDSVRPRAA